MLYHLSLACRVLLSAIVCLLTLAAQVGHCQGIAFSIDAQSPTAGNFGETPGLLDSFYGEEIDGGDILTVGTPIQPPLPIPNFAVRGPVGEVPGTLVFGVERGVPNSQALNLLPTEIGSLSDAEVEIDALSFGRDDGRAIFFSVDRFATGTQDAVAEQAIQQQAPADIFRNMLELEGNSLVIDGRGGEEPNRALGLGLIEENPLESIDNVDALAMNPRPEDLFGPIYFSLDAGFGNPPGVGSAQQNNVSGADILIRFPGDSPQVFLNAQQLGLNQATDDVDALALFDAAQDGEFDPNEDLVLFSVRQGSQIIDQIDSALGQPIGPGDILTLPSAPNQSPQIFLPAELLGLNVGQEDLVAAVGHLTQDDLDALSIGAHGDGDMNCNFVWDPEDVPAFALSLHSTALYEATYDLCFDPAVRHGDLNQDGRLGFQDIEDFVRLMENAGTLEADEVQAILSTTVPEPDGRTTLAVGFFSLVALWTRKRK